jgi:hypothetical protein
VLCGGCCQWRRWLSWLLVVKERMQAATSQVVTLVMFKHTRDDTDVCLDCYSMGDFNGIYA